MQLFNYISKGMVNILLPKNKIVDVVKKYPATFNKDDKEVIKNDWIKVGETLRGAINKYEKEVK